MKHALPSLYLSRSVRWLGALGFGLLLTACGGGGGGGNAAANNPAAGVSLAASSSLAGQCDGGTQEKAFLRSYMDENYLWSRDVPTVDPSSYSSVAAYFNALKVPAPVDRFSTAISTAELATVGEGIERGYGIRWLSQSDTVPRKWVVSHVEAGSPAALAGVQRGDLLAFADGVNFVNDETDAGTGTLNAALSPADTTTAHTLEFTRTLPDATTINTAYTMAPKDVAFAPVHGIHTFTLTDGSTVGYLRVDAFLEKADADLVAAIQQLQQAQVGKVFKMVLDLRYNGGGHLATASRLAYMLAGPAKTAGKTFERISHNDKNATRNWSTPFYASYSSTDAGGKTQQMPLPTLDLDRVTFLVTHGTASAAESLINGLRGINMHVDLIGDTTRGKPYGFYPQDNCGTTYFVAQFQGRNDKNESYVDGFTPVCTARDGLSKPLGSSDETLLKSALWYLEKGTCAANASAQITARAFNPVRPATQEMSILPNPQGF